MKRSVIVYGDATDHGGVVIEASSWISVDGKNVALIGDMVSCPKCNGLFPIVEGVEKLTFMGMPAALEGMRTGCGAMLIASQYRFTVDDGSARNHTSSESENSAKYSGRYRLVNEDTGEAIINAKYQIFLEGTEEVLLEGVTDSNGYTDRLPEKDYAETVAIRLLENENG